MDKWIMKVPVLSTCHIPSPEEYDWMVKNMDGSCANSETCFVWVSLEEDDPEWFREIAEYLSRGYPEINWVRFDPDGDVIPELKTYDW